ncbi:alpha/beta fold hydrolase [Aestuariibacter salexigens]|uniref:alpha/beta fold hydrolase n=1 Tax=Aestuariibacter salexigens TaxID=226010 RepID=UPI000425BE75|nr:alpha/beta hydrolase [Aestuariibacter salexigens]
MAELIHFAHANGFPSGSYRKLFKALEGELDIIAIDRLGHDPAMPIDDNWVNPAKELCSYVAKHANQPVYAIGHSFGAVVSYLACCMQPQLFKGLLMLEPPLAVGLQQPVFRLLKKTPLIDKVTPAGLSKYRKYEWQRDEDVVGYFKQKGLFRPMDPECVEDYVASAIEHHGDVWKLRFHVDVETAIFRTLPHNLSRFYGRLQCPSMMVTAEHSNVCKPSRIKPFLRGNRMPHQVFSNAGHMFPLEQPKQVAKLIKQLISDMAQSTAPSDALAG